MSLPYDSSDLEPYLSEETISYHYGAHHKGYVDTLNRLIKGTPYENLSLLEVIQKSFSKDIAIFNNAAQVWNHDFYWKSLSSCGETLGDSVLKEMIVSSFGTMEDFFEQFKQASLKQFGSGWSWLVKNKDQSVSIVTTSNASLPSDCCPLLTCDVWEHAYYLDHQNKRAQYVEELTQNLWSWSFAIKNYEEGMML